MSNCPPWGSAPVVKLFPQFPQFSVSPPRDPGSDPRSASSTCAGVGKKCLASKNCSFVHQSTIISVKIMMIWLIWKTNRAMAFSLRWSSLLNRVTISPPPSPPSDRPWWRWRWDQMTKYGDEKFSMIDPLDGYDYEENIRPRRWW